MRPQPLHHYATGMDSGAGAVSFDYFQYFIAERVWSRIGGWLSCNKMYNDFSSTFSLAQVLSLWLVQNKSSQSEAF